MGIFQIQEPVFLGGTHGFVLAYKGVEVSFLQPSHYKPGVQLLGLLGTEPPFKTRAEEIMAWGAVCTKAGETLLQIFDTVSFGKPDLGRTLHDFHSDAAGIVGWHLRQEGMDMPAPDVFAALQKEMEQVQAIFSSSAPQAKKTFVFKNFLVNKG